ncbi:16S rRNA (guanine(527)-N(7))-methyltransferase RsmG [Candidatus Babeliales bacterium]|nr:16S rRNA (guanine(527)-N(7))-methyltransferase RsmG [Candidatus Babeliales bacterium]
MVLTKEEQLWQDFMTQEQLTLEQTQQFRMYYDLLQSWNEIHNLTTRTTLKQILRDHFQDSLALKYVFDISSISSLADIGSGGGFPGIPLKIKYPHLSVVLVEVTKKKITFLEEVIATLGLQNIEIFSLDWRTFLRTSSYDLDLLCARASLGFDELVRMFKPGCRYKNAQLVYWASQAWEPTEMVAPCITGDYLYTLEHKKRRLIVLQCP